MDLDVHGCYKEEELSRPVKSLQIDRRIFRHGNEERIFEQNLLKGDVLR